MSTVREFLTAHALKNVVRMTSIDCFICNEKCGHVVRRLIATLYIA
jgi:hypothetical protein